jgi:predicted dehydrogenase
VRDVILLICCTGCWKDPIGENNVVASFRFADGSIGNLTYCTVGSKTSGGEHVEAFAPGIAAVTEDFKELVIKSNSQKRNSSRRADKGYAAQLGAFIQCIRSGKQPEVTVLDGARATIGCLSMLQSAKAQEPVEINLAEILNA